VDKKNTGMTASERAKLRELEQELEIKNELLAELEARHDENQKMSGHKEKELEQENLMFKELIENLEGITESEIEQFFSMISHELKTPLVPVQGYVKMLKDEHLGKLEQIQKDKLTIIDSSTSSLINLIQNMLDYQKLASGKMEFNFKKSSLRKIIDDAFLVLDADFTQNEIKKEISLDSDIEITCDPKRITQVIGHLLSNCLKSIESKKGKVWVSTVTSNEKIQISVRDNGCGIPNDELDKIFTKFYQVDMSNTREKGGIGLGLSICKKIIEAHKGTIWAESIPEKETTLNFSLPAKNLPNTS
jgi:signal transduction histidine kinase